MKHKTLPAAFTLTGTVIGAGILGLPYVFAKSGFLVGVFWTISIGLIMILINLYLGEIVLKTKQTHQLPGYAEKYLGKWGKRIMFFALTFGIYSALVAYLIGEAESISQILPINPIIIAICFWLIMTLLIFTGIEGLKKVETYGVIIIIIIIMGILISLFPQINIINLSAINMPNFFLPFGVTIFALLGFTAVPEMKREVEGQGKKLKKAIWIGMLIPIILYIIFTLTFVGILGNSLEQVATVSFSNNYLINFLGIFTMLTSYLALSFALQDTFKFDLKLKKLTTFFWVSILPLAFYLALTIFKFGGFIKILSIGGVISGGLTGILILLMHKKAKDKPNRKIAFSLPSNLLIIIFLIIFFVTGVVLELFF